jgi:hypothetical protein
VGLTQARQHSPGGAEGAAFEHKTGPAMAHAQGGPPWGAGAIGDDEGATGTAGAEVTDHAGEKVGRGGRPNSRPACPRARRARPSSGHPGGSSASRNGPRAKEGLHAVGGSEAVHRLRPMPRNSSAGVR